jgi:hypothetical protein
MRKLFILFGLVLLPAVSIAQCAMCRSSVSSTISNGRNDVGNGLNFGILYMMSFPYIIVAIGIWLWFRHAKSNQRKRLVLDQRLRKILENGA